MNIRHTLRSLAFVTALSPLFAQAAVSNDEANKSNNPLNPAPGLNFQDYYSPDFYDTAYQRNDFLLRAASPLPANSVVPVPQILRATLPVSTVDAGAQSETGLGDFNIFDIFLLKTEGTQLGLGPLITAPTASDDLLGTGKWQAGLAAVAVQPLSKGLFAGLLQWQSSFAGDEDRADVQTLTAQPLLIYNLPDGWYLRSTGIWTFDMVNNHHYIPVGAGAGKVWKAGSVIMNGFVEPQWTVIHDDGGVQPKFVVFAGLNLTFTGLGKK